MLGAHWGEPHPTSRRHHALAAILIVAANAQHKALSISSRLSHDPKDEENRHSSSLGMHRKCVVYIPLHEPAILVMRVSGALGTSLHLAPASEDGLALSRQLTII